MQPLDFDCLRRAIHSAPDLEERDNLIRLLEEWEGMTAALRGIKHMVVGDKTPNWKDDWATTRTRVKIADICDGFLQH